MSATGSFRRRSDHRVELCEQHFISKAADPIIYCRILWSNEAIFKLNGQINRHNCVHYDTISPHLIMSAELNVHEVTVWAGICSYRIVGRIFLRDR